MSSSTIPTSTSPMILTADDITDDMIEEMTCPVCLELLQEPYMLPCSHNFCASCLQQLVAHQYHYNPFDNGYREYDEENEPFPCPSCRRMANPNDVKPNLLVKNMVAMIAHLQQQRHTLLQSNTLSHSMYSSSSTSQSQHQQASFTIVEYVPNVNHVPVSRQTMERWMRLSDTLITHNKTETRDEFVVKAETSKTAQIARNLIQYDLTVNKNVVVEHLVFPIEHFEVIRHLITNPIEFNTTLFYTRLLEIEQQSGVSRIDIIVPDEMKVLTESEREEVSEQINGNMCSSNSSNSESSDGAEIMNDDNSSSSSTSVQPYFRIEGTCKYSMVMARALLNALIPKTKLLVNSTTQSSSSGNGSDCVQSPCSSEATSRMEQEEQEVDLEEGVDDYFTEALSNNNSINHFMHVGTNRSAPPDISQLNRDSIRAMNLPMSTRDGSTSSCQIM